jgi:hypothetical protein
MNVLTKNDILSLISEQIADINEMANAPSKNWHYEKLENGLELDLPEVVSAEGLRVPVKSLTTNEAGEKSFVNGKIFGHQILTGPSTEQYPQGRRILAFANYEGPHNDRVVRFVELDEDDNIKTDPATGQPVTLWNMPRNKKTGTTVKPPDFKTFDDPREQEKYDRMLKQRRAKYYVFKAINETFGDQEVVRQFIKCGAPRIVGAKGYTKLYTDVVQDMDFVGPNLNFTIITKTDSENINSVISTIWNYRRAIDTGQELPTMDRPTKQIRAFAKGYPKSSWSAHQVLDSEEHAQLTQALKLWMQAVKGGLVAFNAVTYLDVMGEVNGNQYSLGVNLSVKKNIRQVSKSRGQSMGNILEPIRVTHNYPIPAGANEQNFNVENYPQLFKTMLINILEGVTSELLNLDPDEVLAELISNPIEVEGDVTTYATDEVPDDAGLIDFGDDDF